MVSELVQFRLPDEELAKLDNLSGERGRNAYARDLVVAALSGKAGRPVRFVPVRGARAEGDALELLEAVKAAANGLTAREAAKKLAWAISRVCAAEVQLQDKRLIDYPNGQGIMQSAVSHD